MMKTIIWRPRCRHYPLPRPRQARRRFDHCQKLISSANQRKCSISSKKLEKDLMGPFIEQYWKKIILKSQLKKFKLPMNYTKLSKVGNLLKGTFPSGRSLESPRSHVIKWSASSRWSSPLYRPMWNSTKKTFFSEIAIMQQCESPFVVRYYGSYFANQRFDLSFLPRKPTKFS